MNQNEINENMVFRLSRRRSPREVKLLHLEWAVVTQLDGEKTVGQIADILALNKDETENIFHNLLKEGLLELVTVSEENQFVPPELFDDVEYELTSLIGPIAGILIDDVLKEMRKERDQFDRASLPILIDLLSSQISNREKQLQFQKNILGKIKSYVF